MAFSLSKKKPLNQKKTLKKKKKERNKQKEAGGLSFFFDVSPRSRSAAPRPAPPWRRSGWRPAEAEPPSPATPKSRGISRRCQPDGFQAASFTTYCGWLRNPMSCTTLKPRETRRFVGIYVGESNHSRVSWVVRNGVRPSAVFPLNLRRIKRTLPRNFRAVKGTFREHVST